MTFRRIGVLVECKQQRNQQQTNPIKLKKQQLIAYRYAIILNTNKITEGQLTRQLIPELEGAQRVHISAK